MPPLGQGPAVLPRAIGRETLRLPKAGNAEVGRCVTRRVVGSQKVLKPTNAMSRELCEKNATPLRFRKPKVTMAKFGERSVKVPAKLRIFAAKYTNEIGLVGNIVRASLFDG